MTDEKQEEPKKFLYPNHEMVSLYFPVAKEGKFLCESTVDHYLERKVIIELPRGLTAEGIRGTAVNGEGFAVIRIVNLSSK